MPREPAPGIRLRRLGPADAAHMSGLLDRLSPDSRYQRFFRLVRSFPAADVARFVADGPGHLAVGAFDGGVLVGVAQYFRSSPHSDTAEVALEVADSHHRRGVGTSLLHELATHAAAHGIRHVTATVLAANRPVLELVRHAGWGVETDLDGIYVDVAVTLPPFAPDPLRATSRGTGTPRTA